MLAYSKTWFSRPFGLISLAVAVCLVSTTLLAVSSEDMAIFCSKGDVDKIQAALKEGFNVNTADDRGFTPLTLTMLSNHPRSLEIAMILINAGADIDFASAGGLTPLIAISGSNDAVVEKTKLLLDRGANPTLAMEKTRQTALHLFAQEKVALELFSMLIKAGADPNAADFVGMTPLMYAVLSNNGTQMERLKLYRFLIDNGAKFDLPDKSGNTPLMFAASGRDLEVVKLFLEVGSDMNAVNKNGLTPLMVSAKNSPNPRIIGILLKAGADPKKLSNEGLNALDLADDNHSSRASEIRDLLESFGGQD